MALCGGSADDTMSSDLMSRLNRCLNYTQTRNSFTVRTDAISSNKKAAVLKNNMLT